MDDADRPRDRRATHGSAPDIAGLGIANPYARNGDVRGGGNTASFTNAILRNLTNL